ncbi:MAG: helix-turn-helix domain-containing protein [Gammaproteobacteria bacterium]|nr:helix-turn-helix domain-containing protein [Gammaproteobacteria bacterium]
MKISELTAEDLVLAELGKRIARRRLDLSITQAELAEQAGVSKRTVERIEAGASAQMSNLIRIFRVLGLMPRLEGLIPETGPGPMELLKQKGKVRQRASSRKRQQKPREAWSWDDDK